ncbi:MAG: chlororespiratory reduction protein 7, partial [Phormidesmis sp.]
MADSMLYSEEMFVFLTPDASETFLTPPELLDKLKALLANQTDLPPELQRLPSHE